MPLTTKPPNLPYFHKQNSSHSSPGYRDLVSDLADSVTSSLNLAADVSLFLEDNRDLIWDSDKTSANQNPLLRDKDEVCL